MENININKYNKGKIPGQELISVDQESKINKLKNFRRKGRSKIMKPTNLLSDAATALESSTPDKKGISQASHHHNSSESSSFDNNVHSQANTGRKSLQTLMRTSSLRSLRASFKSKKRPSFKVKAVGKPTCSSTIKNSKFPGNVGLKPGQTESDRLDMYKVCSYHHCSLHGHSHDSSNPPRRLPMRRKSLKSKKSIKRKNEIHIDGNSNTALSVTEDSNVDSDQSKSLQAEKEKHMSMWHLIRRHLHSGIAAESKNKPPHHEVHDENLADDDDSSQLPAPESYADSFGEDMTTADQDVKLLAVKLVREAIQKILLPEVPDQSSDSKAESSTTTEKTKREIAEESDRKAPKHWSSLKKWVLLQRFIKEMEKVRKINPMKPRDLQVEPDPEAENVHLRCQTVDERKRAEEWMLDYALQQAISQLAPSQKRKVEMLVKAFETVVPPLHIHFTFPKLKCNGEDDGFVSGENETILSSCKPIDNDTQSSDIAPRAKSDAIKSDCVGKTSIEYAHSIIMKTCRESEQQPDEFHGGTGRAELETQNYISMWHMVSQHVLSDIASKVGSELLDGAEETITLEETKSRGSHDHRRNFNRDDAIKLVREAVNEILITQSQDDSVDTKSDQLNRTETAEHNKSLKECDLGEEGKETTDKGKPEVPKSKKWSKLKNLLLLKRSIMALEDARKLKLRQPQHLPLMPNPEPERVDLRHQMMDERKKAEEWMLDYAVQNIVTKLTPARKRRVAMLVEAFEAVVPFPEI